MTLLKSKRFQIAALGLVGVVLVHFGLPEEQASNITTAIEVILGLAIAGYSLRDPGQTLVAEEVLDE